MAARREASVFEDMVQAVLDKHGQMDIRLDRVSWKVPILRDAFELNGTVSVTIHMRDLTDREKQAHVAKTMGSIKS